jgi:hypothetical protein
MASIACAVALWVQLASAAMGIMCGQLSLGCLVWVSACACGTCLRTKNLHDSHYTHRQLNLLWLQAASCVFDIVLTFSGNSVWVCQEVAVQSSSCLHLWPCWCHFPVQARPSMVLQSCGCLWQFCDTARSILGLLTLLSCG